MKSRFWSFPIKSFTTLSSAGQEFFFSRRNEEGRKKRRAPSSKIQSNLNGIKKSQKPKFWQKILDSSSARSFCITRHKQLRLTRFFNNSFLLIFFLSFKLLKRYIFFYRPHHWSWNMEQAQALRTGPNSGLVVHKPNPP